jgi:glutamine amidotransferase
MKIGVINYGMGNIASVSNALSFIGFEASVINSPNELEACDKIILPGVGAFPIAMKNLNELQFLDALNEKVFSKKTPIIGLCLGMQLLFDSSEEHGNHNGLGWVKGQVKDLKREITLTVPHMGWNRLEVKKQSRLLTGINEEEFDYYFVHSFYCKCENPSDVIATVNYGVEMDVMIQSDNVFGCQFHPEKSQKSGLELLKNFCKL